MSSVWGPFLQNCLARCGTAQAFEGISIWTAILKFMFDFFDGMQLDTEKLEGWNNRVKRLVKMCPSISWERMSKRLTSMACVETCASKEMRELLAEACVAVHDFAHGEHSDVAQDHERFAVLNMEEVYGISGRLHDWRIRSCGSAQGENARPVPSASEISAARAIKGVRRETSWVEDSRVGLRISGIGESVMDDHEDVLGKVWIFTHKFRQSMWVAQAVEFEVNSVRVSTPFVFRPLLHVFEQAREQCISSGFEADAFIELLTLTWDSRT